MAQQLMDPVYRILVAQARNIERIATGLILPGTNGLGQPNELWGPSLDLIRLYSAPWDKIPESRLANWERTALLTATRDTGDARITQRNDRVVIYRVDFAVRLTLPEEQADERAVLTGAFDRIQPLAEKIHKLRQDWHLVFFDNHELITDDCPQGLCDDAEYTWELADVAYPVATMSATVTCQRSSWT